MTTCTCPRCGVTVTDLEPVLLTTAVEVHNHYAHQETRT